MMPSVVFDLAFATAEELMSIKVYIETHFIQIAWTQRSCNTCIHEDWNPFHWVLSSIMFDYACTIPTD